MWNLINKHTHTHRVTADPAELENGKEAEREAQGTQGLRKNCRSRERVSPLSRLIRCFRRAGLRGFVQFNKYPHTHILHQQQQQNSVLQHCLCFVFTVFQVSLHGD